MSDFVYFFIGVFFAGISIHMFMNGVRDRPYRINTSKFILSALFGLWMMALEVLSIFNKNNMSTTVLKLIFICSLILTIGCSYIFIKGIKNPPYKNILFQCIIFMLLGLYTMVISILKMFDIALWP
jgi:hypothetical protein